jgi:hypothetical protein
MGTTMEALASNRAHASRYDAGWRVEKHGSLAPREARVGFAVR